MGLLNSIRTPRIIKSLQLRRWSPHKALMEKATEFSTAVVLCHQDTWTFAEREAEQLDHWRAPSPEPVPCREEELMIEVRLSGPQLALVIEGLARGAYIPYRRYGVFRSVEQQAIARRIYLEIANVLRNCAPNGPDTSIPAIVIDRRIGTAPKP